MNKRFRRLNFKTLTPMFLSVLLVLAMACGGQAPEKKTTEVKEKRIAAQAVSGNIALITDVHFNPFFIGR